MTPERLAELERLAAVAIAVPRPEAPEDARCEFMKATELIVLLDLVATQRAAISRIQAHQNTVAATWVSERAELLGKIALHEQTIACFRTDAPKKRGAQHGTDLKIEISGTQQPEAPF